MREAGFEPDNPQVRISCTGGAAAGFPRHLSQHVGGFVISQGLLEELVPIENAAMEDRTVIEWDKDDLDDLGLLKVDVLGLGMLSALRRGLDLVDAIPPQVLPLADVPKEDARVYEMISRADTIGVFQVESRAQMSMLPRLRPQKFYDLVIEVAIVRPGPDPGRHGASLSTPAAGSRSGHLSQRRGERRVVAHAGRAHLPGTGHAARHRRGRLHARRGRPAAPEHGGVETRGGLGHFEQRLIEGMSARGYDASFRAADLQPDPGLRRIRLPESHAASFALLVYSSAWLKCYEPAAFTAALLNSQPMGFYAPAQLVRDAPRPWSRSAAHLCLPQ
jgi:error-prone DNA polymerase